MPLRETDRVIDYVDASAMTEQAAIAASTDNPDAIFLGRTFIVRNGISIVSNASNNTKKLNIYSEQECTNGNPIYDYALIDIDQTILPGDPLTFILNTYSGDIESGDVYDVIPYRAICPSEVDYDCEVVNEGTTAYQFDYLNVHFTIKVTRSSTGNVSATIEATPLTTGYTLTVNVYKGETDVEFHYDPSAILGVMSEFLSAASQTVFISILDSSTNIDEPIRKVYPAYFDGTQANADENTLQFISGKICCPELNWELPISSQTYRVPTKITSSAITEWYNIKTIRSPLESELGPANTGAGNTIKKTLYTLVENWDNRLIGSEYRMVLLRYRRRRSYLGSRWAMPMFNFLTSKTQHPSGWQEVNTWWPITISVIPPNYAHAIKWFSNQTGTYLADVLPLSITEDGQYRFCNTRTKTMKVGVAIYKKTGVGTIGWQRVSNIANVEFHSHRNAIVEMVIKE